MRDRVEFLIGRDGELIAQRWLKDQGFHVLDAAAIEKGGAPAIESALRKTISPDLLVFSGGGGRNGKNRTQVGSGSFDSDAAWVEIKTKTRSTFNQRYQREEHGIALRLYREYRHAEKITGIRGALAIVERDTAKLLLGYWDEISHGARECHQDCIQTPQFGEAMIFFDRRMFGWNDLGEIADSFKNNGGGKPPVQPRPPVIRPWEQNRPPHADRQPPLL